MKTTLCLLFMIPLAAFGQNDFEFVMRDSCAMTQNEIYLASKRFIAETWNDPNQVIKNDDPEAGVILLRGLHIEEMRFQGINHVWKFTYQVKFQMRDNEFRVSIENVSCESADAEGRAWPLLPMSLTYPERGYMKTSLKEDRYLTIMQNVHGVMQSIQDRYAEAMKKPAVKDDW